MEQNLDYSIMEYRRQQLEEELDQIRNIVSGREESFLSKIQDENGRYDPEKIETLIDEFIDCYQEYAEFEDQYLPPEQGRSVEGDVRKLLHHFLYLAIQGPICHVDYNCFGLAFYSSPVCYQDILFIGRFLEYHDSLRALYQAEAYYEHYYLEACLEPSLFDQINWIFYDLSGGTRITDTYELTREEWDPEHQWGDDTEEVSDPEHPWDEDTEEVSEQIVGEDSKDSGSPSEAETSGTGVSQEEYEDLTRSMQELEDMDQLYDDTTRESEESYRRWKESLPDAAEYCRIYLEFRKLYVPDERKSEEPVDEGARGLAWFRRNLLSELTKMIDAYLFRNQISPYSLGRSYGLVASRMKNTSAHLRAELARARRMEA